MITVFHCFAHCLLPRRAFASLYVLLFLEKEAEIGGRGSLSKIISDRKTTTYAIQAHKRKGGVLKNQILEIQH